MDDYIAMKERHQEEVNNFPMFFAFSGKQFHDGMKKLGLDPSETDKIYSLSGTGGFYRKCDAPALQEMFERHWRERQAAIETDMTGEGYIYEMFDYELSNHEYGYTGDTSGTLDAIGLTYEEIAANPKLLHGFKKACEHQEDWYREHN